MDGSRWLEIDIFITTYLLTLIQNKFEYKNFLVSGGKGGIKPSTKKQNPQKILENP